MRPPEREHEVTTRGHDHHVLRALLRRGAGGGGHEPGEGEQVWRTKQVLSEAGARGARPCDGASFVTAELPYRYRVEATIPYSRTGTGTVVCQMYRYPHFTVSPRGAYI